MSVLEGVLKGVWVERVDVLEGGCVRGWVGGWVG